MVKSIGKTIFFTASCILGWCLGIALGLYIPVILEYLGGFV